ncbi:unnamed protein product [Mycena citricolor]|uniref:Carboxypeptidase n=1 Tax=Mycena citricolor TaxID=2018698 RepID=A0AAD2Q5X6_9AGAR|nr:unnamed protein product [Mycena citricolor]
MRAWSLFLLALPFATTHAYAHDQRGQTVLGQASRDAYDAGLFTPYGSLGALSADSFTTLSHPVFPGVSVRIKKSGGFCDNTVSSYTGYIDIEARHIFFYFFESRSDPAADDVVFWTNGGPGCSSSLGLFMELGPCRVLDADGPKFHPQSWNANANLFFVDQPIGVGFSYADYGEAVGTTEDGAKDMAKFVFVFFEHFSQFKGRPFHMTGESYGGRYVPVFAAEVYDQNARLLEDGYTPINLTSVMIGNGITDFYTQMSSSFDMMCTPASLPPLLSISWQVKPSHKSLVTLTVLQIPRCEARLKKSCVDAYDYTDCAEANSFCSQYIKQPFYKADRNPYDISKECNATNRAENLCYPLTAHIRNFLSRPDVRKTLGVDASLPANFSSCDPTVSALFRAALDGTRSSAAHVAGLLERGVRVLIYVGTYDWSCNWVGNERWTRGLEWSGREAFAGRALRPWSSGGKRAGLVREARGLTFLTVEGAGHMVPYDKPEESLDMLQRWLAGKSF